MTGQVRLYYADLRNEKFETYLALVHSRFSTNTFPSWSRAQPMRMLCHNGEINTLKGNANWMRARESVIVSPKLGAERTQQMMPVIDKNQSDSGSYDNVLEFLYHGSERSLQECMLMMIPEPWQNDGQIDPDTRAFYRFYANVMEPWDGPAMIAFTNGDVIGATLDRNGLRPSRYYVVDGGGDGAADEVVLSSEVGCLQGVIPTENIIERGRLRPGQIFMVNLLEGKIIRDKELKKELATGVDYKAWEQKMLTMDQVTADKAIPKEELETRYTNRMLTAHGYTTEAIDTIVQPMGATGKEVCCVCVCVCVCVCAYSHFSFCIILVYCTYVHVHVLHRRWGPWATMPRLLVCRRSHACSMSTSSSFSPRSRARQSIRC